MINQSRHHQQGLSLIELMIAIMLSIFITAAMISLFVNSKQNYRLNENMSRLQENARFAVSFIARDLRMADYRTCITKDRLSDAIAGTNGSLNNPDTVTIIWQSSECGVTPATINTTIYSIQTGSSGVPALFRSINGVNTELVEGIDDMQILYGEDTDHDDAPNYFVDSASVSAMAQVVSVRLSLVAGTMESNLTTTGGRITRDFTSTVTLRNRLP